jgi:hypothetical protein
MSVNDIGNDLNVSKSDHTPTEDIIKSSSNRVSFQKDLSASSDFQSTSSKSFSSGNKRSPLQHINNQSEIKISTKNLKIEYSQNDSYDIIGKQNLSLTNGSDNGSKYATPLTVYSKDVFGSFMKSIDSTESLNSRSSYNILNDSRSFHSSIEYNPPHFGLSY